MSKKKEKWEYQGRSKEQYQRNMKGCLPVIIFLMALLWVMIICNLLGS
mgnify:CR=1 FL=1